MSRYFEILFRASSPGRTKGPRRTRTPAAREARWKFREAVGDTWYVKEVKTTFMPKKDPQT